MKKSIIVEKTFYFSKRISKCCDLLRDKREFVIADQLMKSGTSIGANVVEGEYAQSKKDFLSKMNIALKESKETEYWINLVKNTRNYEGDWDLLLTDCVEIIKILHSIVKTTRDNLNKNNNSL